MPRSARLDIPGLLHHVRARGIERGRIFRSDRDREEFLARLEAICEGDAAFVYAWCLMPNHVHFAIRSGTEPLSKIMRRLLTGHAVMFNKRYERVGHLFENRYRSTVVEDEPYLLALVRYIHLNPVRARIVPNLAELAKYPWSGHATLMGSEKRTWQDTEEILSRFGREADSARRELKAFMSSSRTEQEENMFRGGKSAAHVGDRSSLRRHRQQEDRPVDDRILGAGRFVESILQKANQEAERKSMPIEERRTAFGQMLSKLAARSGFSEKELTGGGRRRAIVEVRSVACYLAVRRLGIPMAAVSRELNVSCSSVLRAAERGEHMMRRMDWDVDGLC